jgi:hypothetical protein
MIATIFSAIVVTTAIFGLVATGRAATFDAPITFNQAGTVTFTLDYSAGGYDHLLYLGPTLITFPNNPPPIMTLTDTTSPSPTVLGFTPANIGDTVSLGSFSANEEVIFRLVNVGSERFGTPGEVPGVGEISEIFSGSLSHANLGSPFTMIEEVDEFARIVYFEDLIPTSDQTAFLDGHDVRFTLTLTPVPVPAAAWLFGSSMIGLIGMAQRRIRT